MLPSQILLDMNIHPKKATKRIIQHFSHISLMRVLFLLNWLPHFSLFFLGRMKRGGERKEERSMADGLNSIQVLSSLS